MSTSKSAQDGLAVVERMLNEGFSGGDTDVVDVVCAPDIVEHQFGMAGEGAEAITLIKQCIADVHAAFPDLRFTVEDWTADGDIVWVRATAAGTNTGPFLGAPTGAPVSFTVFDVVRIADGRIVEHWGVPDRFEILARLGRLGPRAAA